MKKISVLLAGIMITALGQTFAQTVYSVTSNSSYSANCSNCTFNVSAGATLTINQSGTCNNCTFNGGSISINKNITCQPCSFNGNNIDLGNQTMTLNSGTSQFSNSTLTANANGSIDANTPVTITNSVFTFSNNATFKNNGGQLDISGSKLNFYGNSYLSANAGPVNLKNGSKLIAGDGTMGSQAYIKINGPALNIYDKNSAVILGNINNYYYNWNPYNAVSTGTSYTTTYPSPASTINCGQPSQHACGMWSSPTVYGPAALGVTGVNATNTLLPVVLTGFSASSENGTVSLVWTTQQEQNAAFFSIERSSNGNSWEKLGTVTAKGNTTTATRYEYTDRNIINGTAYYRLVMVDLDGRLTYSDNKLVKASAATVGFHCYPNPAVDHVTVTFTGNNSGTTVQLISQAGQLALEAKSAANSTSLNMNVQMLLPGMYMVKTIAADGAVQTGKLVVIR